MVGWAMEGSTPGKVDERTKVKGWDEDSRREAVGPLALRLQLSLCRIALPPLPGYSSAPARPLCLSGWVWGGVWP